MSDSTPAPVRRLDPPPTAVRVAKRLWVTSLVLGLIAGFFIFLARADQLERLRTLVTEVDDTLDSETLGAVALILFWGTLGGLALLFAVEAIMINVMLRGRGGARWALMVLLVINAAAILVAESVLIAPDDAGLLLRLLLLAQLVLASAGLVSSLLPRATVWFRVVREARARF